MDSNTNVSLTEACEEIMHAAEALESDGQNENESDNQNPPRKTFHRATCSVVHKVIRNNARDQDKSHKRLFKGSVSYTPYCAVSKKNCTGLHAGENSKGSKDDKSHQSSIFPFKVAGKGKSGAPSYPFKVPQTGKPVAYVRFVITRFSGQQTVFPTEREVEMMKRILMLFTYNELEQELRNEFRNTIKKLLPFYSGEHTLSDGYQRRIARTLEFLKYLTKNREAEFVVVPAVPTVYVHLLTFPGAH